VHTCAVHVHALASLVANDAIEAVLRSGAGERLDHVLLLEPKENEGSDGVRER
jgi:hypothetical protein